MEKFYVPLKEDKIFKKENCYMFIEQKKLDDGHFYVKIGQVYAILLNRVIFSETYEFITENPQKILKNFKEISIQQAKSLTDNTNALLDKNIFRR
jgi:hypothetical protein